MASQYVEIPQPGGGGPGAGVTTFNGRFGSVVSTAGDYNAALIANTPAGNIAATDVQAALNELDSEKQVTITGAASTIVTANLTPDQAVVSNGSGKIDTVAVTSTELSYVAGVGSPIQSQIDTKQAQLDGNLNFNSIVGTDGSGTLIAAPGLSLNGAGGVSQFTVVQPDDLTGNSLNNTGLNIEPLQNSPDENWNLYNNSVTFDANNSGFSFGTNGTAVRVTSNYVSHSGSGDIGETQFTTNNFNLGNGTDPIDVRGAAYIMGYGQFNDNVNVTGAVQGYGFQPNYTAGATVENTVYSVAFFDSLNADCALPNHSSFNGSPIIAEVQNNNNYTGVAINATVDLFTGNSNYNGVALGGNLGTFGTGSYNGVNINPNIDSVSYAVGLNVSMDNITVTSGAPSSIIIQDLTVTFSSPGNNNGFQLEYLNDGTAGAETAGLAGQLITVHMQSGVSTATQIKAAIEANFTLNSNLTVTISGVASNPQTSQAATNFSGGVNPGTKKAAYLDGDVEITGSLQFGGALSIGKLDAFSSQALTDGGGPPASIHSLITMPTVAANATISNADLLGVNTAMLLSVGDNATVTTSFLGLSALGLPAVVGLGTGATVDRVSGAVFALSLDATATGGTVDILDLCRALAIPNGVTTVNKLAGYKMDLPFGDPGTTTWGFYESPGVNNYFAGNLLIGGTAGSVDTVTNDNVALEIDSTTKVFLNARLTTVEKLAIAAPIAGMQCYDSTLNQLSYYNGSTWVNL